MGATFSSPPGVLTPRTNNNAMLSMIVGIISWVLGILFVCSAFALTVFTAGIGGAVAGPASCICCPLLLIGSVFSTVTGYRGRNQIRLSNGLETGDGMALAGLIMGGLGIAVFVLFLCGTIVLVLTGTLASLPGAFSTPFPR